MEREARRGESSGRNRSHRFAGGDAGLPQRIKVNCITHCLGWSYCKCCHTLQKEKKKKEKTCKTYLFVFSKSGCMKCSAAAHV